MKRMKLMAIAVAALLLLSACNVVNVTEAATIGDTVMNKPEFMYYLQTGKSQAMQEAQNQGLSISKDEDWNTIMLDGKTAAEYAKEKALESMKTVMVLEAKGKAEGFELGEDGADQIASMKEQLINQLGGRYSYEQELTKLGISTQDLNKIVERNVYANAYISHYSEGNEDAFKPSDEDVQAKLESDYVYVRHILIKNQPETAEVEPLPIEEEPISAEEEPAAAENEEAAEEATEAEEPAEAPEEEPAVAEDFDAQAKAKAEDILAKLEGGADFVKLMNENSEDGRGEDGKLASDGYLMTDNGQMDPAFEEAAMKLAVGEYTKELVQSSYGYHIIMRFEIPKEGEEYDNAVSTITSELTSDNLQKQIDAWAEELGFSVNQKFMDRIKIKMEG